ARPVLVGLPDLEFLIGASELHEAHLPCPGDAGHRLERVSYLTGGRSSAQRYGSRMPVRREISPVLSSRRVPIVNGTRSMVISFFRPPRTVSQSRVRLPASRTLAA